MSFINKIGDYARNVATLMTGSVVAQILPIAVSPILTRLYTPADFGLFALFSAVVAILNVIASGRYELAIVLPKKDSDAASVFFGAILLTCLSSLIVLGIVELFSEKILELFSSNGDWLYFIPVFLLILGVNKCLLYWCVRKKDFKSIAMNKVVQHGSIAVLSLGFGFIGMGGIGLIIGGVVGQALAVIQFARVVWLQDNAVLLGVRKLVLLANMRRYSDFLKYTSVGALLDTASCQSPAFFVSHAYNMNLVGAYGFIVRVLTAPMAIVGSSVGHVYFQNISNLYRNNPGSMYSEVVVTARRLLLVGALVFLPIIMFGPTLFGFVFGHQWVEAGGYAQIVSLGLIASFVVSPLTTILSVTNNNRILMIWQTMYFVVVITTFWFSSQYSIEVFLWVQAVVDIIMYALYYRLVLYCSLNYSVR